ncbi:outer membrane protein assembly factor BamB family protein [Paractinoplanes durhamensis]|uniref:outer membrane protein assembly factor BamB family protein n=1 Tax=Paractinoplanes durhamensis TaxID=113563 RepID=UPI00362A7432
MAAAAAVVLVVAGVGFALRDPHPRASRPASTPTPTVFTTGVPIVGTVSLGTRNIATGLTAQDGERAYAAWVSQDDNKQWVIAADLASGAESWPAHEIADPDRSIEQIVVVPEAVLVVTVTHSGATPERALYAFDPAGGVPLWNGYVMAGDSVVFTHRMLVRSSRSDGAVEGLDWRTGERRWVVPMEDDRPARTIGMRTAADEERIDRAGARPDLTDGRVVVITVAGKVRVLDAATGTAGAAASVPVGSGDTMVAYEGRLFSHDEADDNGGPHHIRATDLTGVGGSAILGTVPDRFLSMAGCGPDRVCVVTARKPRYSSTVLTAFDAAKRKLLWEAPDEFGGSEISSARGRVWLDAADGPAALYDTDGTQILTATLSAGWLDAGTLLIYAPDGTGRWSRWSIANRKITPLGAPPGKMLGFCASTSSRLACPGEDGLRIWAVG